jgi:hypothetical protein
LNIIEMGELVGVRFFAVPGHLMTEKAGQEPLHTDELVEPELPPVQEAVEKALSGAEFRDMRARDRLRVLLSAEKEPKLPPPSEGCGPSAVFAQPPQDLPALLRLADQLESLAKRDEGEKALVWKCNHCNARYAVPVALVRQVSIRCEQCNNPVDLHTGRSLGEETLVDPSRSAVNTARRELAVFFREAMARGWPVLVCSMDVRRQ